jgi:hypothetical protein
LTAPKCRTSRRRRASRRDGEGAAVADGAVGQLGARHLQGPRAGDEHVERRGLALPGHIDQLQLPATVEGGGGTTR